MIQQPNGQMDFKILRKFVYTVINTVIESK